MRLLKHHVLEQRDGIDVLQLHGAVLHLLLADHHALRLRLEQHAAGADGGCLAVLQLRHVDGRETDLEDVDAVELDLLTQLEEVLQSLAELLQDGLDVALLHTGLELDELGKLLGADEIVVIHRLRVVLAIRLAVTVVVLCLDVLL